MFMYLRKMSLNISCPPFLLPSSFSEMPTNNFIESSFWNFDALFQPQQHPARDAHDTFFLKGTSEGGRGYELGSRCWCESALTNHERDYPVAMVMSYQWMLQVGRYRT